MSKKHVDLVGPKLKFVKALADFQTATAQISKAASDMSCIGCGVLHHSHSIAKDISKAKKPNCSRKTRGTKDCPWYPPL